MIIAVDFDGTLQLQDKKPNLSLIQKLKAAQRKGHTVILWTCREGKRLTEALLFLRNNGFVPNYVNRNCPQAINALGHDTRKIYADVYIDDKSC
jgi:hypothetical protein